MTPQQADAAADQDWFIETRTNYATGDIAVHCRAHFNDNPDLPTYIKRFSLVIRVEVDPAIVRGPLHTRRLAVEPFRDKALIRTVDIARKPMTVVNPDIAIGYATSVMARFNSSRVTAP